MVDYTSAPQAGCRHIALIESLYVITAIIMNDSSSATALSMNCGSAKEIVVAPANCHKYNDNRSKKNITLFLPKFLKFFANY